MMELSELTVQLRSKGVKISLKPNYKKYYRIYPHVIRFHCKSNNAQWGSLYREVEKRLHPNLVAKECRLRNEGYDLNVYCLDVAKTLSCIPDTVLKGLSTVEIAEMTELVREESSIKPELPRAETTVVKRLPYGNWRYRVHWPTNYRIMKRIGTDALNSIFDHIQNDEASRSFNDRTLENFKRGYYWGGSSYFYTNSENILCLISLINPTFIKRIEKFTTLEELNEKTTG
jgi:hypothetical protein